MSWFYPALDIVGPVLPGMLEREHGGLLFTGGLSAIVPIPSMGSLAISSAALRNYVLTLYAAITDQGVCAGILTIGGLIERGGIHRAFTSRENHLGGRTVGTLGPDTMADAAWEFFTARNSPEANLNAFV